MTVGKRSEPGRVQARRDGNGEGRSRENSAKERVCVRRVRSAIRPVPGKKQAK